MNSTEIRKAFLEFMKARGHTIVPSSSLVPSDPSVLLTTAGMQQFKPYYTGELDALENFGSKNTASAQKCFRTSDIEEVGDATHNTFFEMLGNFSFGGYMKKEAIELAHDFLTEEMGIPISYVTIFKGSHGVPRDDESKKIWHDLGVQDIRDEGMEDVFWGPTGSAGPCGPTTEIYAKNSEGKDVEIWNIVFNQFFYPGSRDELLGRQGESDKRQGDSKKLEPLPTPGVDTGMGFERLVMTAQKKRSIYETDIFSSVMSALSELAPIAPETVLRIIADHVRAATFLIADGVRPLNKDAGYILRRLLRRMIVLKINNDIHGNVFRVGYDAVKNSMEDAYPEIAREGIVAVMEEEEEKFSKAITRGVAEIKNLKEIGAKEAFYLYESFGLPYELIRELTPDASKNLNHREFDEEFKKHQELSRAGAEKKFGGHGLLLDTGELKAKDEEELKKVTRLHTATHLMQAGLRKILGPELHQAGSDITVERTRFDFTFSRKLTADEIRAVEDFVNGVVAQDLPMGFIEMDKKEAEKTGALFFFKQKYPERVKVYFAGHTLETAASKEFCGGPHVTHTSEIGTFKIAKEEAVGAGTRRIRATVMP